MVRTVMMATSDKLLDVLIVDDHPVVISGCRSLFASAPDIRLSEASNEKAGHEAYLEIRPDISIIDINLPGLSGFELLRRIREADPAAKIIVFNMNDEPAFVVRDRNYVSARWPGDAHTFAKTFAGMLQG